MVAIIADNQDITRIGMERLCTESALFDRVCTVTNRKELTTLLEQTPQAAVILDYTLFDLSQEYLFILHERFPETRWLLLSDNLSASFLRCTVGSDVSFGIVTKDSSLAELNEGLHRTARHEPYICSRIAEWLRSDASNLREQPSPLTSTEQEILHLIAMGRSTKEIAAERCISVYTVMTHRKNIFRKLKVNNAYEATRYAFRAGLVDSAEYYI